MMGADRMSLLVAAPVLVPLATALAAVLWSGQPRVQRAIGLAGTLLLLAAALALTAAVASGGQWSTAFGGWDPPFAIEFVADGVAVSFVLLTAVMSLAATATAWGGTSWSRAPLSSAGNEVRSAGTSVPASPSPVLIPLTHAFVAGACGAFLTADLFNFYVWFEVVLSASLGLLVMGGGGAQLHAALTFFVLNVVGTLFVLMGVALVYAATGHLQFAALERAAAAMPPEQLLPFVALLAVGFLVKAAAFPVFAWLPATYHTLPAPTLALFAAVGTKVGVYAVLRLYDDLFGAVARTTGDTLGWFAVATMVTGVLGAAYHWDIRRILAFHSISQVGYILLGIALGTAGGAQAALVFALHHSLVKANLFLIAALIATVAGSYDLRHIGGLMTARPWLATLFLVQALSLVGIPPLSGFWAKFLLVRETVLAGHLWWAGAALAVGALTLYSMLKIWLEAFWRAHPRDDWQQTALTPSVPAIAVAVGLAVLTTAFGLWPDPVLRFTTAAAAALYEAR
jgi:multicomponent Na+:H+ antiporter subunit D